jgi:HD superfamily phosphohydrolase YqeK
MFGVDSTEAEFGGLTSVEMEAARGELPVWSRARPERRQHMGRVAALLEEWAYALGLDHAEALRWAAAGWLHDVLRDADPAELVHEVSGDESDLPGNILHGPAAAARLQGRVDDRVVTAVRYHTIGHPRLDELGRALYLADFLEPGRDFADDWRADLRRRMPVDRDEVLIEVVAARITHLLARRSPIRPETAMFWTGLVARKRP